VKPLRRLLLAVILIGIATGIAVAQTPGGVLRAAMTTNAATMDAHLSTTTAVRQVAVYLHESLVTFDENYEVIAQLAQDWDISEDRLTYTFRIRPGLTFHDGSALDAGDVKATVERYIAESQGGSRFNDVAAIEVVDPLTVRFTLTSPSPLLVNLAQPSPLLAVYPQEIIEKYGDAGIAPEDAIGLGPYRLEEWRPDVYTRLVRFEDYVPDERYETFTGFGGRREAYFDEVQLIPVPEAASRVAGLQTGEFDFIESVPITAVAQLEDTAGVEVAVLKPKWAVLVELNQGEPPMDDLRFRQAMVRALDMDQIMRAVTFGNEEFYRLQPSIFFPEQTAWFTEAGGDVYNQQDRAEAQRLLREVGYNSEPIIYLANRDFDWMYKAVLAAAAQWQQAGINVQIEFMDWPSQIQRAQSLVGWHINQTGWSPRFDPTQLFSSLSCASVGSYNYCNEEMDSLLGIVNQGLPQAERRAAWEDIQELVWDDVAVIRFGDFHEAEALKSELEGYVPFYVTPRFWNVHR
jgi:peptide/nickel transport system substrate-binding protein